MSLSALNWALRIKAGSSSRKLVLIALANWANAEGEAYPSAESISSVTELNRKTVLDALSDLAQSGLIQDTGRRVGATSGVRVWQLNPKHTSQPENGLEANPKTDLESTRKRVTDTKEDTFIYTNYTKEEANPKTGYVRGLTAQPRLRSLDSDMDRPLSATEKRMLEARRLEAEMFAGADERDRQLIQSAQKRRIGGTE